MTYEVSVKIDTEEEEILLVDEKTIYGALQVALKKWSTKDGRKRRHPGTRVRSELRGRGLLPFVVIGTVDSDGLVQKAEPVNGFGGILLDYQQPSSFSYYCLDIYAKVFPEAQFAGWILLTVRIQGKTFDLSSLQLGNNDLFGHELGDSVLGEMEEVAGSDGESLSKLFLYTFLRNMVGFLVGFFSEKGISAEFRAPEFPSLLDFCNVNSL